MKTDDGRLGALTAAVVVVLVVTSGCGGDGAEGESAAGSGQGAGGSGAGTGSGAAGDALWACDTGTVHGTAVAPSAPYFTEVSFDGIEKTNGFGRAMVVDVDGDGFDDIVATPAHDGTHVEPPGDWDKLVMRSRGDGTFEDFTAQSGLDAAKVGLLLFGDVDDDGDQDAYAGVIAGQGLDAQGIWLNDGAGHFTHAGKGGTVVKELACGQATCTQQQMAGTLADFDGDGVLDLYVGGWFWSDGVTDTRYSPPAEDDLYRGVGDGTFQDVSDGLGVQAHPLSEISSSFGRACMGVSPGDWDGDGDLDLFVGNYGAGRPKGPFSDQWLCEPPRYWDQDLLWRNDGAMSFVNVADEAGVAATSRGPNGILEEEPLVIGAECPPEVQGTYDSPIGSNSFSAQWADFDNDGDLDLVTGSIAHPDYLQSDPTSLFVQNDGVFSEEAQARGLEYREDEKHASWADFDNDGLLDLQTTGLRNEAENEWRLYRQGADHAFAKIDAATSGVDDRRQETVLWIDFDRDGDLDVWIAEDDGPAKLYRNDAGASNRWLVVKLAGKAPRDATGARITMNAAGGRAGTQSRVVTGPNGHYNPQLSRAAYFGLGGDACATGVEVRWPDGEVQAIGDVKAGVVLSVEQGGTISVLE